MLRKLKLLFLPFLISSIAICGGYTFLNWLFTIKLQLFSFSEMIVNFVIPCILPAIPVFLYIRPRLKLLNLQSKRGDWMGFYTVILWFALAIPTIIAQIYIDKATGKLTALETIDDISKHEPTKYYTVKHYLIDKTNAGVITDFDVSGRYNEHFDMRIFIALPILSSPVPSADSACAAWMGYRFSKTISNRLEDAEKDSAYNTFAAECQVVFDKENFNPFVYLKRVANDNDADKYKEAVLECKSYRSYDAPVLLAVDEPFEERLGNGFMWIFLSFGIGAFVWLIMIVIPSFDESQTEIPDDNEVASEFAEFIDLIKPKEGFVITPWLIYINVGIYTAMVVSGLGFISFESKDLLTWGANFRPYTMDGQWWRLLSSTFLHGGIMHLLANMYGLLFVGIFLEPLLGRIRFAIAYLITGIIASLASLWWYEATVSVGASGAIFGMYGMFLAFLVTKVYSADFAKSFLISTSVFIGINLVMGLTGGIDNAAHIGGLVSGFIIGIILRYTLNWNAVEILPEEQFYDDTTQS